VEEWMKREGFDGQNARHIYDFREVVRKPIVSHVKGGNKR
jgi:hypothetical protein